MVDIPTDLSRADIPYEPVTDPVLAASGLAAGAAGRVCAVIPDSSAAGAASFSVGAGNSGSAAPPVAGSSIQDTTLPSL